MQKDKKSDINIHTMCMLMFNTIKTDAVWKSQELNMCRYIRNKVTFCMCITEEKYQNKIQITNKNKNLFRSKWNSFSKNTNYHLVPFALKLGQEINTSILNK